MAHSAMSTKLTHEKQLKAVRLIFLQVTGIYKFLGND